LIHLALWILSTLFVIWFFIVCGALLVTLVAEHWGLLVGLVCVICIIVVVNIGGNERGKAWQATPPPPANESPAATQLLADSVRTAVSEAIANSAPPVPQFSDAEGRLAYLRWLGVMSRRLQQRKSEWLDRKEFLQTVWYESKRAGLDTGLTLGLVESVSNFRKFYVAENGALGYMAVSPDWTRTVGDGDAQKLFHMQTNLRFGCVVLRHYIDQRNGDVSLALADYYEHNVAAQGQVRSKSDFPNLVLKNARQWGYPD
jgi:hypothetical protein